MSDTPPVPFDALLRHRGWVRALARRLVADENAADDVEQETWLEAMRHPPRDASSPRGWLAAVVRNAARKFGRSASRRSRHELAAAAREPERAAGDLVAEAELGKRLVELVLALDEPYRATVLQRHFEGLETAEIARRAGVPVETVRTRLKRATAQLRDRMDERHGGRRAWALVLVGPAWRTPDLARVGKGIAMGTAKKAAIAVAVLVVIGAVVWQSLPEGDGTTGDTATARVAAGTASSEKNRARPSAPAAKETPAVGAGAPAVDPLLRVDPATAHRVTVRTADAAPVPGAVIELFVRRDPNAQPTPAMRARFGEMPSPDARFTTGADGVALLPKLPRGVAGTMTVRRDGFAVASADAGAIEIVLLPACAMTGRVVDARGRPVASARVVAGSAMSGPWFGLDPKVTATTADAAGRFELRGLPRGTATIFACWPGGIPSKCLEAVLPGARDVTVVLAGGGTVAGRVTEAGTGAPVEGAVVSVSQYGSGSPIGPAFGVATSGTDGAWRVEHFPSDTWDSVEVAKPGWYAPTRASHSSQNAIPPDGVVTIDLQLARGGRVTGRVLGPDGPVAGASISAIGGEDGGQEARRTARSGDGGAYAVEGLPPGRTALAMQAKGCVQEGWSGRWVDDFRAGKAPAGAVVDVKAGAETIWDLVLARGVEVSGRVVGPDGAPVAGVHATLSYSDNHESDGPLGWNGAPETTTDASGTFTFTGVAPETNVRLLAYSDAGNATRGLAIARADVRDVVLSFRPPESAGVIHVRVVWPDGAAPDGATYLVGDLGGWVATSGNRDNAFLSASPRIVPRDGRFDVPVGPPGTSGPTVVRVVAQGFAPADTPGITLDKDERERTVEIRPVPAELARLAGRVVVKGGDEPVAGAQIRLRLLEPTAPPPKDTWYQGVPRPVIGPVVATTGADGTFDAQGLVSGAYDVQVIAPGCEWWTGKAQAPSDSLRAELTRLGSISGRVHFADGSPAAGVRVDCQQQETYRARTTTDDDGRFRFDDAPARGLTVWVGYQFDGTGANIRQQQVKGWKRAGEDLDIVAERGLEISGRIVDATGAPVTANAIVHATPETKGVNDEGVSARPDGTFVVRGLAPGRYRISAELYAMPWRQRLRCDALEGVETGATGLTLVARSGLAIEGVAEIPAEAKGSALRVVARKPELHVEDYVNAPDKSGTLDSLGHFLIDGLEAGRWRIVFQDDQGVDSPWQAGDAAIVEAGETGARLALSTASTISGRVVFEGEPMQNCNVWIHVAGDEKAGAGRSSSFGGRFTFVGLDPSKRWVVGAWREGLVAARAEGLAVGTTDVELALTRGLDVKGRLLRADGSVAGKTSIALLDDDGSTRTWLTCNDKGEIDAHAVPPGEYVAKAYLPPAKEGENGAYVEVGRVRAGDLAVELRLPR